MRRFSKLNRRDLVKVGALGLLTPSAALASHANTANETSFFSPQKSVLLLCELGTEDVTLGNLLSKALPDHHYLRDYFYTGPHENQSVNYSYQLQDGHIQLSPAEGKFISRSNELKRRLMMLEASSDQPYLMTAFPDVITAEVLSFLKKNDIEIILVSSPDRGAKNYALKNFFLNESMNDWCTSLCQSDRVVSAEQWDQVEIDWPHVSKSQFYLTRLKHELQINQELISSTEHFEQRLQSYVKQLNLNPDIISTLFEQPGNVRFFVGEMA